MGEGDWCFALCELRGDNAGTPELIKNYCSGAAGFAKRRQVFTELLWTSCRRLICNYMLVFFRQALSNASKSPYPDTKVFWLEAACWKESGWRLEVMIQKVATGSKMLHTIMSLQESEWECVKPWIHRSPGNQVFEWANTTKELVTVRGRTHLPTNATHTSHMWFFFYVFKLRSM